MTPRERRLKSDFEKLKAEFSGHPYIKVTYEICGEDIPERYFVNYSGIKSVNSNKKDGEEKRTIEYIYEHKIEINLHYEYPKIKPQCFMLTGIFHPNIRLAHPHDICIGDYWAPGETIVDVIYQIGDMLQYLNYNVNNPLNGIAAKWAKENIEFLPIDKVDLRQPEIDIELK